MMMVELQNKTYLQYKRVSTDALACEGARCHRDSDSRLKDIEGPPRYVYDILLLSIHTASVQALNITWCPATQSADSWLSASLAERTQEQVASIA